MPAVLDMNADKISDRFNQVSSYLGIKDGFSGFCAFVREFNTSLKIPENLSGLGVTNVDIKKLTEEALKDPSCGGNPIELNSQNVGDVIKKIIWSFC